MSNINLTDLFKVATYSEVKDFGRNQGNRKIAEKHANEFYDICKNYKEGELVYSVLPIVVNKATNNVLDGQNRLRGYIKAVEDGTIPPTTPILIAFEDIKDDAEEKRRIIDLNCKTKNWKDSDYYESYAITNDNYARLKNFALCNSLCYSLKKDGTLKGINYRYAAAILKGISCQTILKEEKFVVNDEEIKEGKKIHDELLKIRNKLGLSNDTGIEPMAIEWKKVRESIDLEKFIKPSTYVPVAIASSEKKNTKNWHQIFLNMKELYPIAQ